MPAKKSKKPLKQKHKKKTSERKPHYDSDKDNDKIQKYFNMFCDLCNYPFRNFLDGLHHHEQHHGHAGYLTCCDKKFFKLYRAMQHYTWHENPEAFK